MRRLRREASEEGSMAGAAAPAEHYSPDGRRNRQNMATWGRERCRVEDAADGGVV